MFSSYHHDQTSTSLEVPPFTLAIHFAHSHLCYKISSHLTRGLCSNLTFSRLTRSPQPIFTLLVEQHQQHFNNTVFLPPPTSAVSTSHHPTTRDAQPYDHPSASHRQPICLPFLHKVFPSRRCSLSTVPWGSVFLLSAVSSSALQVVLIDSDVILRTSLSSTRSNPSYPQTPLLLRVLRKSTAWRPSTGTSRPATWCLACSLRPVRRQRIPAGRAYLDHHLATFPHSAHTSSLLISGSSI